MSKRLELGRLVYQGLDDAGLWNAREKLIGLARGLEVGANSTVPLETVQAEIERIEMVLQSRQVGSKSSLGQR